VYYQQTIENKVTCLGVGLHSGKKVTMTLHPAPADTGVIFRRLDKDSVEIPASALLVERVDFATSLARGETTVKTVEHLLAVLYCLGIDNIIIDLDNSEVPIMDGSGAPFVFLIKEAGIKSLDKPKHYLKIVTPIHYEEGDKWIKVLPSEELRITYFVSYPHALIGEQTLTIPISPSVFEDQIAPARTFGFLHEVEYLRQKGLTLGGSKDNAVVLDENKILNDHLRFPNEFVRHKILDLLGDLSLCGVPLKAHIYVHKGGHYLHTKMAQLISSSIDNHEITMIDDNTLNLSLQQPFA
jgi:UDP-3-O-[3-hydroxymyristoyl] N-acetylglucosamine deacetylase